MRRCHLIMLDEALDDVALSITALVIVPLLPAIAARKDDHLDLFGFEHGTKRDKIIAVGGKNSVKVERNEQRDSTWVRSWRSPPVKMERRGKPRA